MRLNVTPGVMRTRKLTPLTLIWSCVLAVALAGATMGVLLDTML